MEKHNIKHIVITGPESSGKTTLAEAFSSLKGGVLVSEFAREYLANKTGYAQIDLLEIAKGQQRLIDKALKNNPPPTSLHGGGKMVVCDTDLLTIKIWSEYKYGMCNNWITSTLINHLPDLYILCKPDFPWEEDPLRENPNDREELYNIYLSEIKKLKVPFVEIGGSVEGRLKELEFLL